MFISCHELCTTIRELYINSELFKNVRLGILLLFTQNTGKRQKKYMLINHKMTSIIEYLNGCEGHIE